MTLAFQGETFAWPLRASSLECQTTNISSQKRQVLSTIPGAGRESLSAPPVPSLSGKIQHLYQKLFLQTQLKMHARNTDCYESSLDTNMIKLVIKLEKAFAVQAAHCSCTSEWPSMASDIRRHARRWDHVVHRKSREMSRGPSARVRAGVARVRLAERVVDEEVEDLRDGEHTGAHEEPHQASDLTCGVRKILSHSPVCGSHFQCKTPICLRWLCCKLTRTERCSPTLEPNLGESFLSHE